MYLWRKRGLSQDEIALAEQLCRAGRNDDPQKHLRMCRCGGIDEMHYSGKRQTTRTITQAP